MEFPGSDHLLWAGDVDPVADEIEEFLTGTHSEIEPDRVLALCCLQTSWTPPHGPKRWVTGAGVLFSMSMIRSSDARSTVSGT